MSYEILKSLICEIDEDGKIKKEGLYGEARGKILDQLGASGNRYTIALKPRSEMEKAKEAVPEAFAEEINRALTGSFRCRTSEWYESKFGRLVAVGQYVDITEAGILVTPSQAVMIADRYPYIVRLVDRPPLPSDDSLAQMLRITNPKDSDEQIDKKLKKLLSERADGNSASEL